MLSFPTAAFDTHWNVHTILRWIPIFVFALAVITLITCYLTSTMEGHEPFFLPSISETGDQPPESSIFSFGMTNTSFLIGIVCCIKYMQVQFQLDNFLEDASVSYFKKLNFVGLLFGFFSAIFLGLVACFQSQNVPTVHNTVSVGFFLCCIIHVCIMTRLFYVTKTSWKPFRVALCVVAIVAFTLGIALLVCRKFYRGRYFSYAAVCEYSFVVCICVFWGLYHKDFRTIKLFCGVHSSSDLRGSKEFFLNNGDYSAYN